MRIRLRHGATLILGVLATHGLAVHAQEPGAAWLDQPTITSWNTGTQDIPHAPRVEEAVNPRCRETARPPQTDEDRQVRDGWWDLVGAFQGRWDMLVVQGAAAYDGMCRPMQYQAFVFVGGRFAGTLAPAPMDSRTDGALSHVTLHGPGQLTAEYLRYAESDPRCCPSRITHVTFGIAPDPPAVHARSATTSPTTGAGDGDRSSQAPMSLAGTTWQLVKFEGGDGIVRAPADRSRYTIAFEPEGRLSARIDCNRGRGTWTSDGSSLTFGPMALTRAMCPPDSLHDQIVTHWEHIRSYVFRDGHLFLSLMADGGIYEFEPVTPSQ